MISQFLKSDLWYANRTLQDQEGDKKQNKSPVGLIFHVDRLAPPPSSTPPLRASQSLQKTCHIVDRRETFEIISN